MDRNVLVPLLFGLAFGTATCSAPAAPKRATTSDPAAVVHEYLDAENRGDIPAALSHITDDIVITGLGLCSKAPCVGTEAIRKEIERGESAHTQHTRMDIRNIGSNAARARVEHQNDASRAAGIDRFVVIATIKVRGDRIVSIARKFDTSDKQTQAFIKYQKAHAPK